jgi:SPRY domain-containing protein
MKKKIIFFIVLLHSLMSFGQWNLPYAPSPPPTSWDPSTAAAGVVLSNNNLTEYTPNSNMGASNVISTTSAATSQKVYFEVVLDSAATPQTAALIGVASSSLTEIASYFCFAGGSFKTTGGTPVGYGSTWGIGDVISVSLDGTGAITFYNNGVSQGVAYTGLTGPFFAYAAGVIGNKQMWTASFGILSGDSRTASLRASLVAAGYVGLGRG